jgi:dihydrofolate reductase
LKNILELKQALQQGQHTCSAIVACSLNRVIGRNGELPWNLPEDLARFKRLTMGKYVVLGRKTMEAIGRALPGRVMVVLSRNERPALFGCPVISDMAAWVRTLPHGQEIMIAGGGEIYDLLLPVCSLVYQTQVNQTLAGDAFFPELDSQEWLLEEEEPGMVKGQHTEAFRFLTYSRRHTR